MAVDEPDKVDAVGVDVRTGDVVLTISDHLDWIDDEDRHLGMIQAKLNYYSRFVESGELLESYPPAYGRRVAIEIVFRFPLSSCSTDYLAKARAELAKAGIDLRASVFGGPSSFN